MITSVSILNLASKWKQKNKQSAHHTMGLDDQSSLKHGSDSAYMNSILEEIRKYKGIKEKNTESLSRRYSVRRNTETDARRRRRAGAPTRNCMPGNERRGHQGDCVESLGKALDSVHYTG